MTTAIAPKLSRNVSSTVIVHQLSSTFLTQPSTFEVCGTPYTAMILVDNLRPVGIPNEIHENPGIRLDDSQIPNCPSGIDPDTRINGGRSLRIFTGRRISRTFSPPRIHFLGRNFMRLLLRHYFHERGLFRFCFPAARGILPYWY